MTADPTSGSVGAAGERRPTIGVVRHEAMSEALLHEVERLREREGEARRREALLASAEEVGQMGSWEFRGDQLIWSDNLYRLYGYEPGSVTPAPEIVFDLTHPDDRARVVRAVDLLLETGEFASPLEYRIRLPGRGVRHLRATLAVLEKQGQRPFRMIGSVFDVTDQRRAEGEIGAHVAVAHALAEWESLDQGSGVLLRSLAEAIEFECGVFWVPTEGVLLARGFWQSAAFAAAGLEAAVRNCCVRPGVGLPGRAWSERDPITCMSTESDVILIRRDAVAGAGLRGAIAFPAIHRDEVLAVLELFSTDETPVPERLVRSLTGIGYEIGQFLAGRRGELVPPALTSRELEVLQLAARGLTRHQIAGQLTVTSATVKTHFENIFGKLEVGGRASAVATALRLGLID
jgi:DNA-binding CsgD family transcriptional regulator